MFQRNRILLGASFCIVSLLIVSCGEPTTISSEPVEVEVTVVVTANEVPTATVQLANTPEPTLAQTVAPTLELEVEMDESLDIEDATEDVGRTFDEIVIDSELPTAIFCDPFIEPLTPIELDLSDLAVEQVEAEGGEVLVTDVPYTNPDTGQSFTIRLTAGGEIGLNRFLNGLQVCIESIAFPGFDAYLENRLASQSERDEVLSPRLLIWDSFLARFGYPLQPAELINCDQSLFEVLENEGVDADEFYIDTVDQLQLALDALRFDEGDIGTEFIYSEGVEVYVELAASEPGFFCDLTALVLAAEDENKLAPASGAAALVVGKPNGVAVEIAPTERADVGDGFIHFIIDPSREGAIADSEEVDYYITCGQSQYVQIYVRSAAEDAQAAVYFWAPYDDDESVQVRQWSNYLDGVADSVTLFETMIGATGKLTYDIYGGWYFSWENPC